MEVKTIENAKGTWTRTGSGKSELLRNGLADPDLFQIDTDSKLLSSQMDSENPAPWWYSNIKLEANKNENLSFKYLAEDVPDVALGQTLVVHEGNRVVSKNNIIINLIEFFCLS